MKKEREGFSFKNESRQLAVIGAAAVLLLIVIFLYLYLSSAKVNVYNVSNNVTVTAEKYVPEEDRININTADAEELQSLEGIGEVTAGRIIEYREANGSFKSIYELSDIKGISDNTVEKIKPYIKLE